TALVLAPFAALRRLAGGEVLAPLATVALAGLLTSTIVMVYALPALYARLILRDRAKVPEPPPGSGVPGGQPGGGVPGGQPGGGVLDEQPTVVLTDEQPTVPL